MRRTLLVARLFGLIEDQSARVTHQQVFVLDGYVTILIDQRLNLKRFDGSFSLCSGSSAPSSSSTSMMTTDSVLAEL